jgi:hypothetical protein
LTNSKQKGYLFQTPFWEIIEHQLRTYTLETTQNRTARWKVIFDATSVSIRCTCLEFETVGLPCEHTFHVMKVERLKEIPQNLISLRWTKIAKSNSRPTYHSLHDPNDVTEVVRYGALTSRCNNLYYIASRSDKGYRQFNDGLDMLTQQMDQLHVLDISYNDEEINRSSVGQIF